MRFTIVGTVLVFLVAGAALVLVSNQDVAPPGDTVDKSTHPLTVELVAAVQNKASTQGTGNPTIGTSKMVSVRVILEFADADAMNQARGDMKRMRRAYGGTIGSYLSNREKTATDDVESAVRARVAKTTDELFGVGVVTAFEVEGQFGEQAAN